MQPRRQQQLACNTPSSKCHSWYFITYSVLIEKKQKTLFFKKTIYFFQSAFTLLISSLSLMLLIMLLNNLPISLEGPFNCIWTYFTTKVETCHILLNPKLKIKFYTRWNPKWFEKYLPNCILSFFFCSIIITQLLSISSKGELQFALCLFHSFSFNPYALNFKNWKISVIVTRHFKPKLGSLNERVYCKPIDRTLKMLFIEGSGNFLRPTFSELLKLLISG